MIHLGRIRAVLPQVTFHRFADVEVRGVAYDSRRVEPGMVFFAIPGTTLNGMDYVGEAIRRGAVAVICERARPEDAEAGDASMGGDPTGYESAAIEAAGHADDTGDVSVDDMSVARLSATSVTGASVTGGIPVGIVPDVRRALAVVSHMIYGAPARSLDVTGVTGTNGKTTTSKMIQAILAQAGYRPAYFGTIGYEYGDRVLPAPTTTPSSTDLARMFRAAVDAGHMAAVIEASSHALAQRRTDEIPFRVAVFTNLTRDHQDYHGSMERYFAAKRQLFDALGEDGVAAIDISSPYGVRLVEHCRRRRIEVVTCGTPDADVRATATEAGLDGSTFTLRTPIGAGTVHCPLPGAFNVSNAVVAAAAAVAHGLTFDAIVRGLEQMAPVPGRMESVAVAPRSIATRETRRDEAAISPTVLVDFAHSDAALETVLETIEQLRSGAAFRDAPTDAGAGESETREAETADGGTRDGGVGRAGRRRGRLHVVFGCGGDRDPGRRPSMGRVAARYADRIIITSDNPRSEDPRRIIDDILAGVPAQSSVEIDVEVDRGLAIRRAIHGAAPEDVVLIAGKGHESYQQFKDVTIPFDDRGEARAALRERILGDRDAGEARAAALARLFEGDATSADENAAGKPGDLSGTTGDIAGTGGRRAIGRAG